MLSLVSCRKVLPALSLVPFGYSSCSCLIWNCSLMIHFSFASKAAPLLEY